jgi:FtsZ-interacting cell division protein ZipA
MINWSWNPIDMIPKTIDKNLRDLIITLVVIQFIAFLILMFHLIWEYIKYKKYCKEIDKRAAEEEKEKKLINENTEPIKFDNEEFEELSQQEKENKLVEENSINKNSETIVTETERLKQE